MAPQSAFWSNTIWYGFGMNVEPDVAGPDWWHDGQYNGTRTLLVHWSNGISAALVFNGCPEHWEQFTLNDMMGALNGGITAVRTWPAHDLFSQYDVPQDR